MPGSRRRALAVALLAGVLAGCSGGSATPTGSSSGAGSAPATGTQATTPGAAVTAGGSASATPAGSGPAVVTPGVVVTVPADRSGIVTGPTTDPAGRPVVVADAGTVTRAAQAVQVAAGDPQARLLGILGVGFTGGQGLLRVTVQDPADPVSGLEYTVDVAGAVVGPRVVPEARLLKGFPAPATAERVTSLGFTLAEAPLDRLGSALAAAVTAGKLPGATVTTWNLTRERTDTSTDATRLEWLVALQAGPQDATVTLAADGSLVEVDAG